MAEMDGHGRGTVVSRDEFDRLLAKARTVTMSAEELEQQRRGFAWGNTNIENERITRAMVDRAAEQLRPS
jgi:hypothetical protein